MIYRFLLWDRVTVSDNPFQLGVMLAGRLMANGLTHQYLDRLERIAKDRHYNLWKSVNYGRKKVL